MASRKRLVWWTAGVLYVSVAGVGLVSDADDSRSDGSARELVSSAPVATPSGVCPPFHLRDEQGRVINPVTGENADQPYSPRQTCGACHDYDKIVQGYHFAQGKGEPPTADQTARVAWTSTPGNYGGSWCSPAPLYRYLSPKQNQSPRMMDMTSFDFVTVGCANCHPGGGPLEFDREGRRYDQWTSDPASKLTSGGDNAYDGDYHKARWSETGVLEADCLLCHSPDYAHEARRAQLKALNFRWAATAASGLGTVTGSIQSGQPPQVNYDVTAFGSDGRLTLHMVRSPRNESCMSCHEQPGWKKRGANYRGRTDVHLRAGLRCVDCHPSGSSADDPRINGREVHDFGKGDDPGGQVRNDLDNTVRDCATCHDTGRFGAPQAAHAGLPKLHLDRIACQTCHIPERLVKPISFQASDVLNPGVRIPSRGKQLWTFYGPEMAYRNHYGYMGMMGFDNKPTESFKPALVRYKGKIWPVNRVHTAWPAIQVDGQTSLMQPKMSDIRKMWADHQADPANNYASLATIRDDNGDGVIEINRPQEIDALISAVTRMLEATGYPMEGKRVVWVMNDRVYQTGENYQIVPKHAWEASPYGNVHKYSHDVMPAQAALGAGGCTDCHSPDSSFFYAQQVVYPFDGKAVPITVAQYDLMGLDGWVVTLGAWRETYLKPVSYGLAAVVIGLLLLWGLTRDGAPLATRHPFVLWAFAGAIVLGAALVVGNVAGRHCLHNIRIALDHFHLPYSALALLVGLWVMGAELERRRRSGSQSRRQFVWLSAACAGLVLAIASGFVMLIDASAMTGITQVAYTGFDVAVALVLAGTGLSLLVGIVRVTGRVRLGAASNTTIN